MARRKANGEEEQNGENASANGSVILSSAQAPGSIQRINTDTCYNVYQEVNIQAEQVSSEKKNPTEEKEIDKVDNLLDKQNVHQPTSTDISSEVNIEQNVKGLLKIAAELKSNQTPTQCSPKEKSDSIHSLDNELNKEIQKNRKGQMPPLQKRLQFQAEQLEEMQETPSTKMSKKFEMQSSMHSYILEQRQFKENNDFSEESTGKMFQMYHIEYILFQQMCSEIFFFHI